MIVLLEQLNFKQRHMQRTLLYYRMNLNLSTLIILLFTGITNASLIEVQEGSAAVIPCDLDVQFPTWTGPAGFANPLISGQTINEEDIKRYKDKNLIIIKTMLKHDGVYTCSDDNGRNLSTEIDVQYFSGSADISAASVYNSTAVFTCSCHSNPPCTISPLTFSYHTPDFVFTKMYPCKPDPMRENRTMCRFVSTLGTIKENNGRRINECVFRYKSVANFFTTAAENIFLFPPTYVNITVKADDMMLTLNCTTDSSNPVALLKWYKGTRHVASNNSILTSDYQAVIVDAEYNGKSVTQSLDIDKNAIKDGEKAFCCGEHMKTEMCTSLLLKPYISVGYSLSTWINMIIVCVALTII